MRLDSSYGGKYVPIPMQRSADEVQDVDMQSYSKYAKRAKFDEGVDLVSLADALVLHVARR